LCSGSINDSRRLATTRSSYYRTEELLLTSVHSAVTVIVTLRLADRQPVFVSTPTWGSFIMFYSDIFGFNALIPSPPDWGASGYSPEPQSLSLSLLTIDICTYIYLIIGMLLYSELMQIPYVHGFRQPRLVQQIVCLCDMANYHMPFLPLILQFKMQNSIHFKGVRKTAGFRLTGRRKGKLIYGCLEQNWLDSKF
jgi:hypothetical protein